MTRSFPTWLRQILIVLGLALVGFLLGSIIGDLSSGETPFAGTNFIELAGTLLLALLFALLLLPILWLAVAIHELGHLAGGWLAGSRFALFIAGPLKISRHAGRLRISLNSNFATFGGLAASVPQNQQQLRRKMLLAVAGGPLSSLLLALLAWQIYLPLDASLPASPGAVTAGEIFAGVFLVLAFTSLAIGILTLIPMRTSGFVTDGARALMLLRGGATAERWAALAALSGANYAGQRPRDWDNTLIEQALTPLDQSYDSISGRTLAYLHALDRGAIEQAGSLIDSVLADQQLYPEAFRPGLRLEAAFFAARYRNDPISARALFEQSGGGALIEDYSRLCTEAALLAAEGQLEAARERARRGLELIDGEQTGGAILTREMLQAYANLHE